MAGQNLFLTTDPTDIGKLFSDESQNKNISVIKRSRHQRETFRVGIDKIPRRELDMWCAHAIWRKGQEEIARTYEVTQGDVSYRIKRAKERITLWREMIGILTEPELREVLWFELGVSTQELEVVLGVFKTTSQSVCAEVLGLSQGNVRHDFIEVRKRANETRTSGPPEIERLHQLLELLSRSYNRLRELGHQKRFLHKFRD